MLLAINNSYVDSLVMWNRIGGIGSVGNGTEMWGTKGTGSVLVVAYKSCELPLDLSVTQRPKMTPGRQRERVSGAPRRDLLTLAFVARTMGHNADAISPLFSTHHFRNTLCAARELWIFNNNGQTAFIRM